MQQARVCSAIMNGLMIFTAMVLFIHVVILTLTVLEEFDEIPAVQTFPMPSMICGAAFLAMVGGNLGFAGSVFTCCVKKVPLIWAATTVSFAILMELVSLVLLFTLIQENEMDEDLQDIFFNVKLGTGVVVGVVVCIQITVVDYYLYLLQVDSLCLRSYLCWTACFAEEVCGGDEEGEPLLSCPRCEQSQHSLESQ